MAWVTKSSDEQYTPEPAHREYTRQEKASNWWHYNKVAVVVAVIVVALIAWTVHDALSQVQPDLQIGYVGMQSLPEETADALEAALVPYCTDRNGDGKVVVQLNQYTLGFGEDSEDADPYSQMAGLTKLSADLSADTETYLYLLADPEGFQEQTQILQYRDGTLPPDGETGDWQQMVYRWSDCPVLAGLDLGSYTVFGDTGDTQFSSQELVGPLYLGFRGNWAEEVPEAYTQAQTLWAALTAGATPPAEG